MGWPPYNENHAYRVALKMVPDQVLQMNDLQVEDLVEFMEEENND